MRLYQHANSYCRYDYNPIKAQFVIRMPTLTHNTFALDLNIEILNRLHSLADTKPDTRAFIEKIISVSGKLEIPILDKAQQPDIGHEPDIMFKQEDAIWPGVVIEVANSQKKKSLPDLADDYILGTYGSINVVVGLDLDYRKSKKASVSIWRLKSSINDDGEVEGEVVQVVDNQVSMKVSLSWGLTKKLSFSETPTATPSSLPRLASS